MSFNLHIDVDDDGVGVITSTHLDVIRDYFSVENKDRNFVRNGKKFLPKRKYAISSDGRFDIGLLNEVYECAKKIVGHVDSENFVVTSRAKYYYEPTFLLPKDYDLYKFDNYDYRDVQIDPLHKIFRRGRGIIEVGTAGGKGLVMASICKTLTNYNPTTTFAIIVPSHLVDKTVTEFVEDYNFKLGEEISAWDGDNPLQPSSKIVVIGQRILVTREQEFKDHIANRPVFLIDECHIVKKASVLNERMKLVKTNNIIGLTGSLPKDELDRFNVLGVIGKVVCKITSREIKNKGLKADSRVVSICCDGCDKIQRKRGYTLIDGEEYSNPKDVFSAEREYLLNSKGRNKFIANIIEKICNNGNVLIPVEFDFQEEVIVESLKHLDRKIFIVNGKTPKKDRTKIYKEMEQEKNAILLAKVGVMREGISINNLSYMIGYFFQKSFIRIVQMIGRIERIGGIEEPVFYDFWDTTPFSSKHYKERKKIYAEEKLNLTEKKVEINYE